MIILVTNKNQPHCFLSFLLFRDTLKNDLSNSVANIIEFLAWIYPKDLADSIGDRIGAEDDFKYAMILGNKESNAVIESDDIHIGLMYLSSGKTFPQHAREANEIFYILSGSAHFGATLQHLKSAETGELLSYENSAPRVFTVTTVKLFNKT